MATTTPGAGPRVSSRPAAGSGVAGAPRGLAARLGERVSRWETPATSYYLLLGATLALVVVGLVMVLSSSSVESIAQSGSAFSVFWRQAVFAVVGLVVLWIASRRSIEFWKRVAWPLVVGAIVFQLLVFTPLGAGAINGNSNWIEVAGVRAQPSEAAKVALVVWCAAVLARKAPLLHRWQHVVVPVGLVAGLVLGLVLLGHDLGTAAVMMILVAAMLVVAGVRMRMLLLAGGAAAAVAAVAVLSSRNRMERVGTWLSGECADRFGTCWQSTHGTWALASGGWWGVGLGASREKWSWLPEAHNDFIYAIIGEELGLPGTVVVLALLAVVAVAGLRVILRHDDVFVKIATTGVLAWVVGQGMVNIAVVLGLLPVIGVPLPLVSSGGSALITTLAALGVVLSFARREPGADDALAARAALVRRSLAVVGSRGWAGSEKSRDRR
jgi:cell division protein FtsW